MVMMRSLSVSVVQGDFSWPFVCWPELGGRSMDILETTVNPVIVA
jgi:hypothetical protein